MRDYAKRAQHYHDLALEFLVLTRITTAKDIRENYSLEAVAKKIVNVLSEIPIETKVRMSKPKFRIKKAYGFKFRARLLYYRSKHFWSSFIIHGKSQVQ